MPTLMENIPAELRGLQRWVCADDGSKRPMRCFDGGPASVSKPDTWGDFEEARACVDGGVYGYAGFVFADDGYVGIDIDHAFGADGMPSDEALAAVMACRSYTEVSKSGEGLHIICRGTLPFKGRNNRAGWEAYCDARYFVLTGRTVLFDAIADAQEGIDAVLAAHFADAPAEGSGERRERIWSPGWIVDRASGTAEVRYPAVDRGGRHLALVSYCGQVHGWGAHRDAVLSAARAANAAYLKPPLDDDEVRQVVASVTRYRR